MDRTKVNSLMDEASSGDGHAYAALASAVQDELFRFAIAQGLERESAADATQEVLMRAYARRSRKTPYMPECVVPLLPDATTQLPIEKEM